MRRKVLSANLMLWYAIIFTGFFSCKHSTIDENEVLIKRNYEAYLPEVKTIILERQNFNNEIISNGVLESSRKTEIRIGISGRLKANSLKNGSEIEKGGLLASIDDHEQKWILERKKIDFRRSQIDLESELLGYGKTLADTTTLSQQILETVKLKSGYFTALQEMREAEYQFRQTRILAPFRGKVANLKYKPFSYVNSGETLCLLIDDREFEVVFHIIEAEAKVLTTSREVLVKPFSMEKSYKGVITAMNPLIDENGLMEVRATVKNIGGKLIEGLNVRVQVRQQIKDQLVIPKEAMVLRDGRKVVFTLRDSIAWWNYVATGLENVDSYTITEGLQESEEVIVRGNLNLAHESKVKVISKAGQ